MARIVISASSLPAGRNLSSQLEYLQRVGNFGADMYHLDCMDGKFVKRESINQNYVSELRPNSTMLFDVHLMVEAPSRSLLKKYAKAGANIISIHYEAYEKKEDLEDRLSYIKKLGCTSGLAIDKGTTIADIEPYLSKCDMILVLCVKVGAGGQKFDEEMLKKIKDIRKLNKDILIEADGGINDVTAQKAVKAGADILAVGTYIYENDTYEAIQSLKGKNHG